MGNKLSCSCAPLIRKAYRYEDSPWQAGARGGMGGSGARRGDTGHLLRCGSLRERKRCAYHTIQPFNHSIRLHYQSLLFWEGYLLLSSNTLIPTSSTEHVHIHVHTYTHTIRLDTTTVSRGDVSESPLCVWREATRLQLSANAIDRISCPLEHTRKRVKKKIVPSAITARRKSKFETNYLLL